MAGHAFEWPVPPHYLMVMKAPMALLLTVALLRWHSIFRHRLDYIAHVSFGIFFIHVYFISAIKVITVYLITGHVYTGSDGDVIPGNVLFFIAYATVVLLMSVLTIWVAQRLTGKNSRMLVGA